MCPAGNQFGRNRVLDLLQRNNCDPVGQIVAKHHEAVHDFRVVVPCRRRTSRRRHCFRCARAMSRCTNEKSTTRHSFGRAGSAPVSTQAKARLFLLLGGGSGLRGDHGGSGTLFQIDHGAEPTNFRGDRQLVRLVGGLAKTGFKLFQLDGMLAATFFFAITFGSGHCETLFWSSYSAGLG
jgi:hypothetical protein